MNQQYPQQPGWGQQPQQPQQPGWGAPQQQPGWGAPPPPPQKSNTGRNIGIGCAGALGLLVVLGIFGAILGDGGDGSSKDTAAVASKDSGSGAEKSSAPKKKEAAPESPVKVTAKKTTFNGFSFSDDSNYTSVAVTVANNSDESIDINPLYFAITDTKGTKHGPELAADENQIDTVKLAPGENVTGAVTGKGKFTPKTVTYTDGFIGDTIRADVS